MRLILYPEFLEEREMTGLIRLIRRFAEKHPLLTGPADYRTSSTVNLSCLSDHLVFRVENRIALNLKQDPYNGEGLAGSWYMPGEGYRLHHDSFHKGTPEYDKFVGAAGNRTWTAMIYLNTVNAGGETCFPSLGLRIQPRAGMLVMWCNQTAGGDPNPLMAHSAEPTVDQPKFIVTQWFRERPINETSIR